MAVGRLESSDWLSVVVAQTPRGIWCEVGGELGNPAALAGESRLVALVPWLLGRLSGAHGRPGFPELLGVAFEPAPSLRALGLGIAAAGLGRHHA